MPKKPTPRGKTAGTRSAGSEDPVRAEQRRLLEAQEDLRRKQEKLQKLIQQAPAREAERKKKQREPIRIPVSTTMNARGAAGLRSKFADAQGTTPTRGRKRRSDRNMARAQFLALCLILLTIVFLIWRAIP